MKEQEYTKEELEAMMTELAWQIHKDSGLINKFIGWLFFRILDKSAKVS